MRIQLPPDDRARSHRASLHRSEEHTSELQSHSDLVCPLLLEKKNRKKPETPTSIHFERWTLPWLFQRPVYKTSSLASTSRVSLDLAIWSSATAMPVTPRISMI